MAYKNFGNYNITFLDSEFKDDRLTLFITKDELIELSKINLVVLIEIDDAGVVNTMFLSNVNYFTSGNERFAFIGMSENSQVSNIIFQSFDDENRPYYEID